MPLATRGITLLGKYVLRQSIHIPKTTQVRSIKRWVAPTLRELERRRKQMPERPPNSRSSFIEWNYDAEIYAFTKRLNEDFNPTVLKQALTHRSYVFKMQQEASNKEDDSKAPELLDNKQMIEAGGILLQKYIQDKYKHYPKEVVSSIEAYLLSNGKLAYIGKHLGLSDLILTEEYPIEEATLSDTVKAVIVALEQSSGLPKTHKFVDDFIITQLNDLEVFDVWEPSDPFRYLTESVLSGKKVEPRLCNQSAGNTILANYQVGLYSDDKTLLGIGWGESVDIAKNTAALDAIRKIYHLQ